MEEIKFEAKQSQEIEDARETLESNHNHHLMFR